ncbi:MAG: MFS transporter [bacterium]|nr:MFS transporter [bacterium]
MPIFRQVATTPQQKKRKGIFGLSGNVIALGFVSFLTDVSSEMIYPLLPVFLTTILGVSYSFVGLIEGVAETTASIVKFFSGWISDKLRKRKTLVFIGYSLSSVTRPLVALATAGWHILAIRFADRVGKGIRTSPRDALVASSCSESDRGKAFGFHRGMDHAGAVLGPLLAFGLLALMPNQYRLVFALASIPGIISLFVVSLFVTESVPKSNSRRSESENTPAKGELTAEIKKISLSIKPFDKRFKWFLVIVILFTLGNSSDAFLILRAKSLEVPVALLPILWVVLHIVKMVSSMPGGILSDNIGRKKVIIAGWLVYALVYFGFAYASAAWHIWLLFAVYGFFFGLTEGTEKALVADLVPNELRGTAYGLYNFAIGIAALPASLLMGIIWQIFGVIPAFLFGASLAFIAAILFVLTIPLEKK